MKTRTLYFAAFLFHACLILLVCACEVLVTVGDGGTVLPQSWQRPAANAASGISTALGQRLPGRHPFREIFGTYLSLAGIENGYGYFGPAVPDSYRLVFELHYPDGRVEYDLPRVASDASGLRVTTLLDYMSKVSDNNVRMLMAKMLTDSFWREHEDAEFIRANFVAMAGPDIDGLEKGAGRDVKILRVYESRRRGNSSRQR